MARINKVEPFVYNALVDIPEARTDDFILILEVLKNFVTVEMSLATVLEHHIELGIPSFASILRIRRKLQKKYPELVNEKTAKMRTKAQKEYKEYAINN